ncbi:MAG: glutamate--cysteine ligase [Halobacteriovoraceae bacterium]|nr:glutamate--cysteine ligase [Halobacteriovoraceae bacterium]|tara:strand:- start:7258 stop:8781 length:1524 start_codon:yes stop_codon:yes gene_type:complete
MSFASYKDFIQNGIERETLRVSGSGEASAKPHPLKLGHKLTHPHITTDFSENLLELITSVRASSTDLFAELACIHGYTQKNIGDELLWPGSMPAILPKDDKIPLAYYGESNVGKLKTLYRMGLGNRYGRSMQTISGVHFNFSLSQEFWKNKFEQQNEFSDLTEFKNHSYFHLIRNFKRYSWLLVYLFGASPLVDKSFLTGKNHKLTKFDDDTYINKNGISLRMGGLGYTSSAQKAISVCFNQLKTYIQTIESARLLSYPEYEKIGLVKNGEYQQLNTNLLQIDNEYYATVRPKNVAKSRESALGALHHRGVEYIEVRLLDCNPFTPYGVTLNQIEFLNIFLCWCLEQDSPLLEQKECEIVEENLETVVTNGLTKGLKLKSGDGEVLLSDSLKKCFDELKQFVANDEQKLKIIEKEEEKILDSSKLPSQQLIDFCHTKKMSFVEASLELAKKYHEDYSCQPNMESFLNELIIHSADEAKMVEANDKLEFDDFLKKYFSDIKIDYGSLS